MKPARIALTCLLLLHLPTPTHPASCAAGQYNNAAGVCTQCPLPTQYSPGGTVTTCSACAPGTVISGTACVACAAGKFSGARASTACTACPSGTASVAGSSACVRCDAAGSAKLANGLTSCPICNTTCTACVAGRYNDGTTKKCSSCAAGKFSIEVKAISSSTCAPCAAGQTTLPTTTGASACISCNATNILNPRSAKYQSAADPLECAWTCNTGYTRFNFSETTYAPATYTALGYSTSQALAIFHNRNDYCCEPSQVFTGMYMCGPYTPACTPACTRSTDGDAAVCVPVPNAHFVSGGTNRFNRCTDWLCDDFFFLDQATGVCTAQPTCPADFTYQRDSVSGLYVLQPSGSFTCVPCSRCIDGSEMAAPCTQQNDTVCRICAPTEFSYLAGKCTPTIPNGFGPVRVRLTSTPVYQGRPSTFYDATSVQWNQIDFTQGFFLNTYTPCQPLALQALVFTGGDEACNRLDISPASLCALPLCKTQCKPWNGVEGWYRLKSGDCSKCIYDTTCSSTQYSDMTTCGPTTAPRCMPCPLIPLPNSLGWLNPGRSPFPGPYPCDIICRDGFAKGSNYSCIPCPLIPSNAKVTGGCNWTCSLGFVQDRSACIPCVGVPTSCATGYYLGYAAATSQCARCLQCTNLVANSVYTSSGQPNGPNTCAMRCIANTFVSPGYGFDTYNNPVACDRCSAPTCTAGTNFLRPCSYLADAECVSCSVCPVGARTLTPCTPTTNTTCTPCPAPPSNATWTERECARWTCDHGFTLQPNTSVCLKCKAPSDCIYSDTYEDDSDGAGCGRCVACDRFLLLPGQCFNGDGQCGVSYWCDPGMVVEPTPPPPYTPEAAAAMMGSTLDVQEEALVPTPVVPDVTTTAPILAYASMATLTLTDTLPTTSLIAALESTVSADCGCNASVTAITHDNTTAFCLPATPCIVGRRRRLLATTPTYYIDVTLVSRTQLSHPPSRPTTLPRSPTIASWQTYTPQPITDPSLLRDRRRMVVYFKRSGTPWIRPEPVQWAQYYLVLGIIVVVCTLLLAAGGGTVYYVQVYDGRKGAQPMRVEERRHRRSDSIVSERDLLLPESWRTDRDGRQAKDE